MTYALRRILMTAPLLLAVSLVVFLLMDALPGDPAVKRFGEHAVSPEEMKRWRDERGLDDPVLVRWGKYMGGVVGSLDFGKSYVNDREVGGALFTKLQVTMELSICALLIALFIGGSVGILSAVFRRTPIDYGGNLLALGGISMPVFWLGMLLWILVADVFGFAYRSGRPEVEGFTTDMYLFEAMFRMRWDVFTEHLSRLFLPAITLSTIPMAVITRMTRAAMLEELGQDYARTASAKGLTRRAVVLKHVLRNALIPITTITGLQFGTLLGGAVLTETVFSWPGLGLFIVEEGVRGSDTPIIAGGILMVSTIFVFINLGVDLLYGVIDPRIRRAS
ncbi:MAG: ABC transporter permease [Planctomycetota bacterium]